MSKAKLVVASLAVAALVTQSGGGIVDAAAKTNAINAKAQAQKEAAVKTLSNLSGVKISGKSTVKLSNVNILAQKNEDILTYTLTYQNNDKKALNLLDYWTKVKTKSGTIYSVTAVGEDKDKKRVVPGSSLSVTYTTKIAKGLKYSDLNFIVLKWNFDLPGYEQHLGSINIPSSYSIATPANTTQKLSINDNSINAKVTSASLLGLGDENYVSVSLYLQNSGFKTFDSSKLKFIVQTASGTPFALTPDSGSSNQQILPQENKTFSLIAKVPRTVNLSNSLLMFVQNEETLKSDVGLASMNLGIKSGMNSSTEIDKEKVLKINNNSIATSVISISRNQSFGESTLSIQFALRNKGDKIVTVPAYSFDIQLGNKSYPLSANGLEGVTLQPGSEQIISVDGIIPVISNVEEMELILKTPTLSDSTSPDQPAVESKAYPIAAYKLPEYTEMQYAVGEEKTVKNNDGTYGVTLDSIQNLPWDDGNLLSTKITITNKGVKAAKLPEFAGTYKMDLTSLNSSVKLVNTNTTQILGPGEKASVYVVANVPESVKFSQLQVQLLQKVGADKTSNWIMFSNYGKTTDFKVVADGSYNNLETAGKKSDLMTRKTYLYKGSTNDIIYTELIMRNLEDKQNKLSQLSGYFQTDQGQYYKANVSQVKTTIGPKAASIVSFSAKVPKGTVVSNWNLVVGESITEDKFTDAESKPTGYVNANAMELNLESRDLKSTLKGVELFPYTLDVKEIEGRTNSSGLEVKMKYDLKRDLTFEVGEFQHKLVLEVMDSSGARFEKEIEIEKDMLVGSNLNYSFAVNELIFATSRSGAFQFSIYDSHQGVKTKIATQAVPYVNSDLHN